MFVSGGTRHVGERDQRNSTHCRRICVCRDNSCQIVNSPKNLAWPASAALALFDIREHNRNISSPEIIILCFITVCLLFNN